MDDYKLYDMRGCTAPEQLEKMLLINVTHRLGMLRNRVAVQLTDHAGIGLMVAGSAAEDNTWWDLFVSVNHHNDKWSFVNSGICGGGDTIGELLEGIMEDTREEGVAWIEKHEVGPRIAELNKLWLERTDDAD